MKGLLTTACCIILMTTWWPPLAAAAASKAGRKAGPSTTAVAAKAIGAPTVRITAPGGGWFSRRVIQVKGTVSDVKLKRATLVVNGLPTGLSLKSRRFESTVVLSPGQNTIQVIAENDRGLGSDHVSFFARVPAKDLKVVLSWDTDKTDVDLHVIDPNKQESYYASRETRIGGKLDRDITTGYGPETFTLAKAIPGTYVVRAKYYGSHGQPQTFIRVDVILFEGTPREKRLTYRGVLFKTSEVVHVTSFKISRALISP